MTKILFVLLKSHGLEFLCAAYTTHSLLKGCHLFSHFPLVEYLSIQLTDNKIQQTEKILNISSSVGYNEVYYFSHSFKKYTGLSPREYREVNKEV